MRLIVRPAEAEQAHLMAALRQTSNALVDDPVAADDLRVRQTGCEKQNLHRGRAVYPSFGGFARMGFLSPVLLSALLRGKLAGTLRAAERPCEPGRGWAGLW